MYTLQKICTICFVCTLLVSKPAWPSSSCRKNVFLFQFPLLHWGTLCWANTCFRHALADPHGGVLKDSRQASCSTTPLCKAAWRIIIAHTPLRIPPSSIVLKWMQLNVKWEWFVPADAAVRSHFSPPHTHSHGGPSSDGCHGELIVLCWPLTCHGCLLEYSQGHNED